MARNKPVDVWIVRGDQHSISGYYHAVVETDKQYRCDKVAHLRQGSVEYSELRTKKPRWIPKDEVLVVGIDPEKLPLITGMLQEWFLTRITIEDQEWEELSPMQDEYLRKREEVTNRFRQQRMETSQRYLDEIKRILGAE